jgi:hypothetical protein
VSRVRFRLRTIMFAIAVVAVMMGLHRWSPAIVDVVLAVVVVLIFSAVVVLIPLFVVYCSYWFIRRLWRQLSRGHSPIPETRLETKRGVEEGVG